MSVSSVDKDTYLLEAGELLADIEAALLDLENDPGDKERLNRIFRAVHTIKGSGSMFGFENVAGFTHHMETVLEKIIVN